MTNVRILVGRLKNKSANTMIKFWFGSVDLMTYRLFKGYLMTKLGYNHNYIFNIP